MCFAVPCFVLWDLDLLDRRMEAGMASHPKIVPGAPIHQLGSSTHPSPAIGGVSRRTSTPFCGGAGTDPHASTGAAIS